MKASRIGRVDRFHYWMLLFGLMATKAVLGQLFGKSLSGAGTFLDILVLGVVIARFHDFDLPTWPAVTLWLALGLVLPVGLIIASGNTSDAMLGAAVLPSLLLYFAIGFIPGVREENAFGPPGQGFAGVQRSQEAPPAASLHARRFAAVAGQR